MGWEEELGKKDKTSYAEEGSLIEQQRERYETTINSKSAPEIMYKRSDAQCHCPLAITEMMG